MCECVWGLSKAAANIEIESTDVCAATLHSTFDLDENYQSKLDFTKLGVDKVSAILNMKVLFLDEARPRMCTRDTRAWLECVGSPHCCVEGSGLSGMVACRLA